MVCGVGHYHKYRWAFLKISSLGPNTNFYSKWLPNFFFLNHDSLWNWKFRNYSTVYLFWISKFPPPWSETSTFCLLYCTGFLWRLNEITKRTYLEKSWLCGSTPRKTFFSVWCRELLWRAVLQVKRDTFPSPRPMPTHTPPHSQKDQNPFSVFV